MTQKIGLEIANGYIKVVSDDSEAVYPNRLKMLTGSEFSLTGTIGTVYEFNNKKYILDEKGDSSGGRSADRYLSEDYLLETLVAVSQVIKERNVALTIGVPCRDFEVKDLKTKITNHLKGKLHNILRDEKGLVYSANMYYDSQKDQPCIGFNFECSNENTNKVIDEIGKLLQEYRTKPFEVELLNLHKQNTKLAEDESQPRPIYPTRWFADYFIFGEEIFTKKYKKSRKKAYEALTPEDLLDFCKTAFSKPSNLYVTIMSNAPAETFYDYKTMQNILTKAKFPKQKTKAKPAKKATSSTKKASTKQTAKKTTVAKKTQSPKSKKAE